MRAQGFVANSCALMNAICSSITYIKCKPVYIPYDLICLAHSFTNNFSISYFLGDLLRRMRWWFCHSSEAMEV